MDLVISNCDFKRLSAATQQELLAMLTGEESSLPVEGGNELMDVGPFAEVPIASYDGETTSAESTKRVIGISAVHAGELLANLADKSQQTLRLFAVAERIGIDELVGDERPYRDMNDLKRSFVGAVNRRLRTVVGNRAVVLFSSDRDRRRIRVLPHTASALRQAMGIPDPDVGEVFEEIESGYDESLDVVFNHHVEQHLNGAEPPFHQSSNT